MLKTQITGAKYLSPQTNQMTNLNIAIPADSKDTEFGTSDILLAKDVVTYLNALDRIYNELDAQTDKINKINESIKQLIDHNLIKIITELPATDIDKNCIYLVPNKDGEGNNVFIEYIYVESKNTFEEVGRIQAKVDLSDYYTKEETDNQIQIAKNSAIDIHNEYNTQSIKLDINDTEASNEYDCPVNVSLTDRDTGCIASINAYDGFRHIEDGGCKSNLYSGGLDIDNEARSTHVYDGHIFMYNNSINGSIEINADKELTEGEQEDGYSPVDLSLNDGDSSVRINANNGFILKDGKGYEGYFSAYGLQVRDANHSSLISDNSISIAVGRRLAIYLATYDDECSITFGTGYDNKFKISCPIDNTEGGVISGIKSLTAFANPSATKVWATDGSTVDLTTKANISDLDTKANKSDVLLKKNSRGGYYIGDSNDYVGRNAFSIDGNTAEGSNSFAAGYDTKAYGSYSHVEGQYTEAGGQSAHAEGDFTYANGDGSHSEGRYTHAVGSSSHAEGHYTYADGFAAHAQGAYNVSNKNAIHSVGIGDRTTNKNAEYIYTKNDTNSTSLVNDPKNGYKYLIGVGGYDGISTDNTTYKSVQEVIADLTARIEQLETKVRVLEAANTPA